ncbi:non-ribosomal peptide synthetase [Burkholderia vietnamiensis]|uniref:non-ribosomal peptide synthetase n=1 Tax=Burkholderia vietnamiensis TaxID=60552 RepID=UPI00158BFE5E|nr:non-ribosomal peptide synthetase [Burkholderia vietnamiensis]
MSDSLLPVPSVVATTLAHARRTPRAIAISCGTRTIDYGEFAMLAQHVLTLIQCMSVRAGEVVAVEIADPALAIPAMLGVAMARAAWVYVDPRMPAARRTQILDDAAPSLVLVDGMVEHAYDDALSRRYVRITPCASHCAATADVAPGQHAYLLYTSGSTGRPKAVLQSHDNLARHIAEYVRRVHLAADDRIALLAPLDTDAALMDVFGSLWAGACLQVYPLRDAGVAALPQWLAEQRITVVHATPTVLRALTAAHDARPCIASVTRVVMGGELADWRDVERSRRAFGDGVVVFNGYGPTECTMITQAVFAPDAPLEEGTLPIGRPVDGIDVVLVGDDGTIGDRGELVVVSPRVALRYWNAPEETLRRFVEDPRGGGARAYRTGDRAMRVASGEFVHLGRVDDQIKLRGHRIEPRDIEVALTGVTRARHAVAAVVELAFGPQLVAAIVPPAKASGFEERATIAALALRLPAFMVPARIVVLDDVVLTRSGKVDRRATTALISEQLADAPGDAVVPVDDTPVTSRLLDIWRGVFGAVAGGGDDFVALGGDSLAAARLAAAITSSLGIPISLRDVFAHRTFNSLARFVTAQPATLPLVEAGRDGDSVGGDDALETTPSAEQAQLFISESIAGSAPVLEIAHALALTGPVDAARLARALAAVSERHDALRTTVALAPDGTLRREPAAPCFDHTTEPSRDDGAMPDAARVAAHLDALRAQTAGRRAPLALRLVSIDARRSLLLIVANHLSLDGLSLRIVMRELASEYARADGNAHGAARARAPRYSAFVADQRAWQRTDAYRQALDWWTHRLRHAEPLDLRGAMSAGSKPHGHARRHTFALEADLRDALRTHCRAHGSTIHAVFLAGFGLLLSRYCRRTDVCIAVPVANRHAGDFDEAAGVFVNTVVMRQQIDESQPAAALFGRAADVTFDALDRQRVPFADVISALGLNGRLSKPLAEAMLVVQRFGPPRFQAEGIHSTDLAIPPATLMSDLCLTVDETDDGVVCHFDHDAGLFDADLVRRMAGHLSNLLRGLLQHPDATVRGLAMLSAAETDALAAGIGATTAAWPNQSPIVEAFVEQARKTPDAIAIVAGDTTYCYRQVDQASTAIAARIRHREAGRSRLVPLITERRETLPILLLAILKSGHAFVPIDANWPPARIAGALGRCDAEVVVVDPDSPHLGALGQRTPIALTATDADSPSGPDLPLPQYDPEAPIYGIFTSGSTGEPKLPLIAHRGIDNRFAWMTEVFSADAPPTTLATTPHVFDSAVWQYLWPLTLGGKVVVPADGPLVDADDMLTLIDRHGITMADFVPSLFDRMVDQLERHGAQMPRLDRLKFLILGGEALRIDSVRRFRAIAPRVCVVNLYGPTEASIGCVYNVVDPSRERQPIGKPIPNCRALILDDDRRLLPRGVAGHLHLAGVCVGLGYRNAPEQSAASFIANPFPHAPAMATLYRTGDLARFGADDSLDYLGRADNQIKLRGVRIDPAEIEAVIGAFDGVATVAVDVCADPAGVPRLVAWVVPSAPAGLHAFCLSRLPISMVPECLIGTSELPLTPGGKLDRKRLRSTVLTPSVTAADVAADAPAEIGAAPHRRVSEIWSNVLGMASVPVNRSFFELGGNSLLAMQLASKMSATLNRRVTVVDIFRYPTVAALSNHFC